MWNKKDEEAPSVEPAPAPAASRPATAPSRPSSKTSTIGPSLVIVGELSGDENLVVNGAVQGKIDLRQNAVTVGRTGQVKADIYGESVNVEGQVQGNLYGQKDVVIRETGAVRGNIVAPRVVLENGSKFKGAIDMEPKEAGKKAAQPEKVSPQPKTPTPAKEVRSDSGSKVGQTQVGMSGAGRPQS